MIALLTMLPALAGLSFGDRLMLTAFGSLAIWFPVMVATRPEPAALLDEFYRRVRPGGAWGPVRARVGLAPADDLGRDLLRCVGWSIAIVGGTVAIGWVLLR